MGKLVILSFCRIIGSAALALMGNNWYLDIMAYLILSMYCKDVPEMILIILHIIGNNYIVNTTTYDNAMAQNSVNYSSGMNTFKVLWLILSK